MYWRLSLTILKINKNICSNVFWHVRVYNSESLFDISYTEIKHKWRKKFPLDKIDVTKNVLFLLYQLQHITFLLLVFDSYTSWSTGFICLKYSMGFYIFDFASFFLKFIFLFNKKHGLFDLKMSKFLSKLK